jgi:hypothetical protein
MISAGRTKPSGELFQNMDAFCSSRRDQAQVPDLHHVGFGRVIAT